MPKLVDAHCHLANLSQVLPLETPIQEAAEQNIGHYLSSALQRSELPWYDEHHKKFNILYSAGIHPAFDLCDLEFDDLVRLCEQGKIWAIGEIGLDRSNPDIATMKALFIKQLDLAAEFGLPVVLHIVGHQQEAFEIMRKYPLKYLIHGYAGSLQAYRSFLSLDTWFTISNRILKEDKHDLLAGILAGGRYLFETDITQYYLKPNESNPLLRLINVIEQTSHLTGLDLNLLHRIQWENYQNLTGHKL